MYRTLVAVTVLSLSVVTLAMNTASLAAPKMPANYSIEVFTPAEIRESCHGYYHSCRREKHRSESECAAVRDMCLPPSNNLVSKAAPLP